MFHPSFLRNSIPKRLKVNTNFDAFVTKRQEKTKHVEKSEAGKGAVEEQHELSMLEIQQMRNRFAKQEEAPTTDIHKLLKKTTRKKFGLELVEDIIPDDLLCEECIASYSTVYCSGCEQVLCPYCADICHPRIDVNTKHPHETLKLIRPIRAGDTSKAFIEKPYPIPSYFIEEPDYEARTGKSLSTPNALAINLRDNHPTRSTMPFLAPRFNVDEKLIFIDPVSREESYGRVISEWDQRHGCPNAPTIKRGDGSMVWYMIERLGAISDIGNIDELVKMLHAKPPPPDMPTFQDVESIPYRHEFNHAREVNFMIAAMKEVVEYGPRRHYKPEMIHVLPGRSLQDRDEDDDGLTAMDSQSQSSPQSKASGFEMKKACEDTSRESTEIIPSPRGASSRHFHDALQIPVEVGPGARSMDAQLRDRHAVPANPRIAAELELQRQQRMTNVLLLPETALTRPEDLLQDADAALDTSLRDRMLRRVLKRTSRRLLARGLTCWKDQLEHLLEVKRNVIARVIQKYVRRWLCRGCMAKVQAIWEAELQRRWEVVHGQFRYSKQIHGGSRTLDKRLYFETVTDANRYAVYLKLQGTKIFSFMGRKLRVLLRHYLAKWRNGVLEFSEGALKLSHFVHENADQDADEIRTPDQLQAEALELYHKFQAKGHRAVSLDDETYVNVSTIPLGLVRVTGPDSKDALPPYHPSLGIVLPAAVPVYLPVSFHNRLHASQDTRLRYGAYKAHMSGPTDDSCWVIPGRVAMGSLPWGKATKRQSTPAVTAILLAGVSTFVSLMEEDEEDAFCTQQDIQPMTALMKKAATGSKFAVDQIIQECNRVIETYSQRLALIPVYAQSDPRYEEANRDKVRCNARIKLAKAKAATSRAQMEKFPKSLDWTRIPFKTSAAPIVNEMLPFCWELERLLAEGKNLFLYSREGHGRVGMVAGCLVGRLYGFKPTETLTRIQQSHDCMVSQEKLPVPITCPQLPAQRALVTAICLHTNKPYQGVTWRSHSDPETKADETHRPKPGVGKGAPLTHTTGIPLLGFEPLMAEVVDAPIARQKQSVVYDSVIERDVKRPLPSVSGRESLETPDLTSMFAKFKRQQDVVRPPPLLNHGNGEGKPANHPGLPLIRIKEAPHTAAIPPKRYVPEKAAGASHATSNAQ